MADLSKVSPGEDFRFLDADVANAILDVARAYRAGMLGRLGGGSASAPQGDPVSVVMQNRTGSALDQYAVVGISDALVPYATDATEFKRRPQFRATTPAAGSPFAILQQPLANWVSDSTPKTIGRAVISGCTPVKLNVTDSGDTYAAPTTSTTELTTQATPGPARILAKQSGTGSGKWGIVLVNNVEAGSSSAAEYEGYLLTSTFNHSGTVDTWEEITGFTVVGGGSSTYIEFPSTGVWRVDVHLHGAASMTSTSATTAVPGAFYARISEVAGDTDLLAPETGDVGGMICWPGYNPVNYSGVGDVHFCALFNVTTANTKGVVLECAVASPAAGTITARVYPNGVLGARPTGISCITLTKVSD